jgi:hypothetical protein
MATLPHAVVYVEAGYSDSNTVGYTARALNAIDINKIRGFFTNDTAHQLDQRGGRVGGEGLKSDTRRALHREHRAERQRAQAQPTPDNRSDGGSLQSTRARSARRTPLTRVSHMPTCSSGPMSPATAAGAVEEAPTRARSGWRAHSTWRRVRTASSDPATLAASTEKLTRASRSNAPGVGSHAPSVWGRGTCS